MMTRPLKLAFSALPALALALGCGESKPLGSVMLAITTDMYIDKDVSRVDIIVQPEHSPTQSSQFNLFPALDGRFLPGTVSIVEGKTPGEFVRIRVIARQESAARVVREAALRIPRERTALLSMPIQWLCDGHVRQEGQIARSNCNEGETCVLGACTSDTVDENALPDYVAEDVFGGGNAAGGGTCFDTMPCFENSTEPVLDRETCTLDEAVSDDLNIAIRLPPGGDGHCTSSECWIPLDRSQLDGWSSLDGGSRVQLPAAVCQHVENGGASVRVSHECASKTVATPTCGPWTLVGTDGDGDINVAPLVIDNLALAAEVTNAATRLGRNVASACASIVQQSAPSDPTPEELSALCQSASEVLGANAPLDWFHIDTRCWPDAAGQLGCEHTCDGSCDPGTLETRCDTSLIVGKCDGTCDSRQCLGSEQAPVACRGGCAGACSGSCNGACLGRCDGVCTEPSEDGYCAGTCIGTCEGLCEGSCDGTCVGTCEGDPNLPVPDCGEGLCRGGCSGEYVSPVCNATLSENTCGLDTECAADCGALGTLGGSCDPTGTWVEPKSGVDPALLETIADALAALLPVHDVQGPAMLIEGARIGQKLADTASASEDPLASANALVRVRGALDLMQAASAAAGDVITAAGAPRERPGADDPASECTPVEASGTAPLIDDFEDGDSQVLPNDGRDGFWHIVRDDSPDAQLSPSEPPVPESNGANGSQHAMHMVGSGYINWGAGFRVDLRQDSNPYDARLERGIKFWARGTTPLRLVFIQRDLATGHDCATCQESGGECGVFYGTQVALSDTWTEYTVRWSDLEPGTAISTPFSPQQLMDIKFEAPAAEQFEFWLDDVKFY